MKQVILVEMIVQAFFLLCSVSDDKILHCPTCDHEYITTKVTIIIMFVRIFFLLYTLTVFVITQLKMSSITKGVFLWD